MTATGTEDRPHGHYFKDVRHLDYIDVYRVIDLFAVEHPAMQHALKKVIAAGQRGAKSTEQDAREAIDSLNRYLQMVAEDSDSGVAAIQGVVNAAQSTTLEDGSSLTASGPSDPHAEMRKTWKPHQTWQCRKLGCVGEAAWLTYRKGVEPVWHEGMEYRRHPDDQDPPATEKPWIDWGGGLPPVDRNAKVEVRLRDGLTEDGTAGDFEWDRANESSDIVAYRRGL